MSKSKHRVEYGENSNASAMDRAATDASRAKAASKAPSVKVKASAKASSGVSASAKSSVAVKKAAKNLSGIIGGYGAVAYNTDRKKGFSPTPPKKAAEAPAAKKATTPAAAPKKPASEAPKPAAKPSLKKGSTTPPAYTIPKAKPQLGSKVSSGFSGNWQGAAATDMQKRGGAKISRGGGLLGKLRKK
jgi:hypothetical protein